MRGKGCNKSRRAKKRKATSENKLEKKETVVGNRQQEKAKSKHKKLKAQKQFKGHSQFKLKYTWHQKKQIKHSHICRAMDCHRLH